MAALGAASSVFVDKLWPVQELPDARLPSKMLLTSAMRAAQGFSPRRDVVLSVVCPPPGQRGSQRRAWIRGCRVYPRCSPRGLTGLCHNDAAAADHHVTPKYMVGKLRIKVH